MKKHITKRLALLLALLIAVPSLKPAFLTPVYAEPVEVSAPEVQAPAAGEEEPAASDETDAAGEAAGTAASEDAASAGVQETGSENATGEGEDRSASENAAEDTFEVGVTSGGGLSHEYYDGVDEEDGMEIIAHPEAYEGEEAAGAENAWDKPSYNAEKVDGKLDISKMINVSPVRDQGYTGLCWMFGNIAAVESGLIKDGKVNANEINLSEKHSAFSMFNKTSGSMGQFIDNDYIEMRDDPYSSNDFRNDLIKNAPWNGYIRRGGHAWLAMQAFTSWKGVVDEDDSNTLQYKDKGTFELIGKEPAIDNSKTYDQRYQVQDADFYAYPWKGLNRDEISKKTGADPDLKDLKQAIVEHGALAGSMCTTYFNNTNTYAYTPGDPWPMEQDDNRRATTTHIVTFVGWDDTVPKEYFANPKCKNSKLSNGYFQEWEFTPPGDGAWICKNSWDVNGSNENGFFYVSYYDGSLRNHYNCFAGYKTVLKGNLKDGEELYDNNYQYNGFPTRASLNYKDPHSAYVALGSSPVKVDKGESIGAVYTAQRDETLRAVGIATREEALDMTLSVYTASGDSLPEIVSVNGLKNSGWSLSANGKTTDLRAGFHSIKLDKDVQLSPGQHFLVLFTMNSPDGGQIIRQDKTSDSGKYRTIRRIKVNGDNYFIGKEFEHKKASGYSVDDFASSKSLEYSSEYDYDIKAFTVNGHKTEDKSYFIFNGSYSNMEAEKGKTLDMSEGLILEPASNNNGIYDSVSADSWKSSDETILKSLGGGKFEALSANKSPVKVSVSTVFGVTAEAEVKVVEPQPDYGITVDLYGGEYDYTGNLISVSQDIVVKSKGTPIYQWVNGVLQTVSGYNIFISENGAKNAGEGIVTVDVSVSDNEAGKEILLKTEDILFEIKPIDITSSETISADEIEDYPLSADEIRPLPDIWFNSTDKSVDPYQLVSYNGADAYYNEEGELVYPYDYKLTYSGNLKTTGPKSMKVEGFGNFTGTRYFYWDVTDPKEAEDPTATEKGFYVSKIWPRVVEYNGNKHVSDRTKAKKGFANDLTIDVKYDGKLLSEGKDYSLKYKNNVNSSADVTDSRFKPCVIVTGLGRYKGLSATRYFAIEPAKLTDGNISIKGLKALYPVAPDTAAKVNPAVTFSFVDSTGATVSRKLKKAVDYKLAYYRFRFPTEKDVAGEGEEIYEGEWIRLKDVEEPKVVPDDGDEVYHYEYYLAVAEGIGNYTGLSETIESGLADPYPWPGEQKQFIVCHKDVTPGNGQLKGTSLKNFKVNDKYKKLTLANPGFWVDELWEDPSTTVDLAIKTKDNKPGVITISSDEQADVSHYITCYDSANNEVDYISKPGNYTLRLVAMGNIPNETMKGQTKAQDLAATKDFKLKVTSGEKLKAENFKLQYKKDKAKDEWADYTKNLALEYDGADTEFRILSENNTPIANTVNYYMTGAFDNNAFPGKYTLVLQGQGVYGTSKLTWNFRRTKLPLEKALKKNGGKLDISQSNNEICSVFGSMPRIKITDDYRGEFYSDEVDTARQSSWFGLDFTAKNNKIPGKGELTVKANADAPYSGKASIDFQIDAYDMVKDQKEKYLLEDISLNAVDNADRVFGLVEDAFSENDKPVVKLYQYDAMGISRKEVALDKSSLKIEKKGEGRYVVNIKADKDGLIKFPAEGIDLPVRVLDSSKKVKTIEITKGTWVDKNFATQGAAYTGRNICPTVTEVRADGKTLSANDFSVDYEDNVRVGTAKVTVRVKGSSSDPLSGVKTFNFKIK